MIKKNLFILAFLVLMGFVLANFNIAHANHSVFTAPDNPKQGDSINITVTGCSAGSAIRLLYQPPNATGLQELATAVADENGTYVHASFILSQIGHYSITAQCDNHYASKDTNAGPPSQPPGGGGTQLCCPPGSGKQGNQCIDLGSNQPVAPIDPSACTPPGGGSGGSSATGGTDDLIGGLKNLIGTDKQVQNFGNLGGLVSGLLGIVFTLAGILMFIWALMGIFQYITAGGNKEGLAKARARITWAVVGFLFIVISFSLSRYIEEIIQPVCTTAVSASCQQQGLKCVNKGGQAVCQ